MKRMSNLFLMICRWPRLTVACALALTVATSLWLPSLDIDLSLSQRFMAGPAVEAYDELVRTFGPEPALVVVADARDKTVWDDVHLERVRRLAREVGRIAGVQEVVSIAGIPGFDVSADVLKRLPFVRKTLVSRDGSATLIVVKPELATLAPARGVELTNAVERIARDFSSEDMRVSVAGPLALQTAAIEYSRRDLMMVTLIAFVVIALLLAISFKSLPAVIGPLAVAAMTVTITLGILSFANVTLSQFALIAIPVLVGLSVLDGVHIVHAYSQAVGVPQSPSPLTGEGRGEGALTYTFAKELAPCIWTSLTTLIGFIVLVTANIAQVRSIGLVIAIGVPLSFILSFTFLPSFLTLVVRGRAELVDPFIRWSASLAGFVTRRCRTIVITSIVITLVVSAGMFRLHVSLDFPKLFRSDVPAQVAMSEIDERFGSSASFELLLSTDHPRGFIDPQMIQRVARLNTALRLSANVAATVSFLDVGLAGALADGADLKSMKLTPVGTTRLLGDVTSTDVGRAMMAQWLTTDAKTARLHVALSGERPELFELLQLALTNLSEGFSDVMTIVPTGFAYLYKSMERVILESFLRTFAYALIGIVIALIVIARGFKRGLASVAANLMPVGIVLGLMGWLGVGVSVGVVILPAVGLGLLADDTIHFVMALERGDSIEAAYRSSGWPIVLTQLILLAVFGSLVASHFISNITLGIFMSLLLVIGLAFDLLFIPAVISIKR